MTQENLEKLLKRLADTSRPDVKNRIRENLDRVWNQQTFSQARKADLPLWRIIMNSPRTKFAIAAVLIIAMMLGAIPFVRHTAPPTFAEVISPLMHAETAVLTIVMGPPGKGPEIHDMIKGNRIRRTLDGVPNVSIIDLEASKILSLEPNSKVAVYVDLKNLPEIKNYMEHLRNLVTILEQTEGTQIEYLDERDLDGRAAVGYHVTYPGGELYIWSDPATYVPFQIEQYEGQITIICKDLQFDVPMDDSLFSMDVPEGYTMQQTQLDLSSGTEEAFILGLGLWAQYIGDGYYPEDVHVEAFIKNAPMMGHKLESSGLSEQEQMKIGMALARHMLFIRFFRGEGEWVYNGKDVHWGDAEIPIFWYKPRGSETWRVIYGDLRVEDVAEADLPAVMTDEQRAANKAKYPAPEVTTFVGEEKAIWHFQPDGHIEVHSELVIADGPEDANTLPVRLPYAEGTLEQVIAGQTELAFEAGQEDGAYTIALPAGQVEPLECVWTLPLGALDMQANEYQVCLRSLIPVTDFKLEVILEAGCGLKATFTDETDFEPFRWNNSTPKDTFGTWHGLTNTQ